MINSEEWRPIPGWGNKYQVSNLGRIKAFERICCTDSERDGQPQVTLRYAGKSLSLRVHRLVAAAFVPNPENKPQVKHVDNNKKNNKCTNLEWGTQSEIIQHAYKTGAMINLKGRLSPKATISSEAINQIKIEKQLWKGSKTAFIDYCKYKFNIGSTSIYRILNGALQ